MWGWEVWRVGVRTSARTITANTTTANTTATLTANATTPNAPAPDPPPDQTSFLDQEPRIPDHQQAHRLGVQAPHPFDLGRGDGVALRPGHPAHREARGGPRPSLRATHFGGD